MKRILIVEDELDQQELIKELMEMEDDFEVITALDGNAALQQLSENRVDLVILDLNLPLKSGISVLESIRKSPALYGSPKVIVYSNYSNEVNKVYVTKLNVAEYLLKLEVEPEQLLSIVKSHLTAVSV